MQVNAYGACVCIHVYVHYRFEGFVKHGTHERVIVELNFDGQIVLPVRFGLRKQDDRRNCENEGAIFTVFK